MPLCPLCSSRKPRRACPALGRQICTVCCGTKRLTEIDCPPACPYLSTSQSHPPAVVQRRRERDVQFLVPILAELTEPQFELMLFFQAAVLRHAHGAIPALLDEDVDAAATALAATLDTASKGIIYQHSAASPPAQRLTAALQAALGEVLEQAGSRAGAIERDAIVALRQMARAARDAAKVLPGDETPVYLKLIGRLKGPARQEGTSQEPRQGRVII